MKHFKLLLFLSIFCCITKNIGQELNKTTPNTIKLVTANIAKYITNGYVIVNEGGKQNICVADFNNDKILDCAVLIGSGKNTEHNLSPREIKLAIFEGKKDGFFKLKNQTGNLTKAFVYYYITDRLSVDANNVITLKHQSMRHDYALKMRYQEDTNNYMLIGAEYNNYGSGESSGENVSTNFIIGKRIFTGDTVKTTKVDKKLKPIEVINDDGIYDILSN